MNPVLAEQYRLAKENRRHAVVTVTAVKGSTPRNPGSKMIVLIDRETFGSIGGGDLERQAIDLAIDGLEKGKNHLSKHPLCFRHNQCCGGTAELFIEVFGIAKKLYIFGAGHVGLALNEVLKGTDLDVYFFDFRKDWLAKISEAKTRLLDADLLNLNDLEWDGNRTLALIMTHDHDLDYQLLKYILPKPAAYIGLIGSQTKRIRFQQKLKDDQINSDLISRFKCPIGNPSFGKLPKHIAISVASEIMEKLNA